MDLIKIANHFKYNIRDQRYKNNNDPFKEFNRLKNNYKLPPITKETIVITPVRVSPISNLLEGLYGYALRLKGYRVVVLMCGQKLKKCENFNLRSNKNIVCPLCLSEQETFLQTFELEGVYLSDLISKNDELEINNELLNIDSNEIENLTFKNINIGKHIEAAIQRYYLSSNPEYVKNKKTIKNFIETSLMMTIATFKLIENYNPKLIFSSHGTYSLWGPIIEVSKNLNVNTVTWGRGYVGKGNIIFSHNNSYLLDLNNDDSKYWNDMVLSDEKKTILINYFDSKRNPKSGADYVNYYSNISSNKNVDLYKELNVPKDSKLIAFFPNIPWDGQAFCKTDEFPTLRKFCDVLFAWFHSNPDVYIIIRIHPAEKNRKENDSVESFTDILYEYYKDSLPNNLRVINSSDNITSYQLKEICQAGITFGSTLSLEFAVDGWPMIQCGYRETSNRNIVFDSFNRDSVFKNLDLASQGKLQMTEEMKERALKYAYHWIFKRHIPEKLIDLKDLQFEKYNFNSIEEFSKIDTLNWMIDKSLNKEPFVWEE